MDLKMNKLRKVLRREAMQELVKKEGVKEWAMKEEEWMMEEGKRSNEGMIQRMNEGWKRERNERRSEILRKGRRMEGKNRNG